VSLEASVPGNLLLAGEYAVLEPGGLGITVAVERRVRIRVRQAHDLEIVGSWGGEAVRWRREGRDPSPLFDAVVREVARVASLPDIAVAVDSSAFFAAPDRKIGYGSSAAVAVGVAAALLRGTSPALPAEEIVFRAALAAHRAFQGGRGSGYDVATSLYGGTGVFKGGESPVWRPEPIVWLRGASVFRGVHSVATSGATARYREWTRRDPAAARRFLEESAGGVHALLAAPDAVSAASALAGLRDLGLRLGEAIGVSAAIEPPPELRQAGGVWKALGAGNEIGIFLPDGRAGPVSGAEPLVLASEGLAWND
jgi:phosphomevalonate kinase